MISAHWLRELSVASPSSPLRPRQLSAASGLVRAGYFLYVVADDEHHLGVFPADGIGDGHLLRLFPGDLPHKQKPRKAAKADLEALTRLPPFPGYPSGALLALPSGSRPNRRTGSVLALDGSGGLLGTPRLIDLSGLYAGLQLHCPALNIEGAVVSNDDLLLMQRGNKGQPLNACLRVALTHVLEAIVTGDAIGAAESVTVQAVDLGNIAGIPLCFTDGAALADGRIVFTAVAEDTEDSYQDGTCAGSAVGLLSSDGRLLRLEPLLPAHKVEGVHAWMDGDSIQLLLVTDADDETVPSCLLSAVIC